MITQEPRLLMLLEELLRLKKKLTVLLGGTTFLAAPIYDLQQGDREAAKVFTGLKANGYWNRKGENLEQQHLFERYNIRPCLVISSPSLVICIKAEDPMITHNTLYDQVVTRDPSLQCVACSGYYFELEEATYLALDSSVGLVTTSIGDREQRITSISVYNEEMEYLTTAKPFCADPTSTEYKQLWTMRLGKLEQAEQNSANKLR